jgi:MFS family permease
MNTPGYDFLPAPLWLITTLHVLTLTLHFVAMNFMFGGLVVLLFGRLDDKWNNAMVQRFVRLLPTAMAATVTLAVAPLLFLQLAYHRQAYAASIVSGWWWLLIIGAVIFAYYFLYGAAFTKRPGRTPVFLGVATILLAYVSLVYSTVFSMAEHPDLYHALYASNAAGTVLNPRVDVWGARWLHMLAGAVTVGGFFVGLIGRKDEAVYRLGRGFFLWGMAVTIVIGMSYLMTLGNALLPLMRSFAMWLVLASLVLSLGSLHFYFRRRFSPAAVMLFASLLSMVVVRHALRLIELHGKWEPASIPVKPQWSVFAVFLVCFVAAIGVLAYMLRVFFGDRAGMHGQVGGGQQGVVG